MTTTTVAHAARLGFGALITALALSGQAWAQNLTRPIPEDTRRGDIRHVQDMVMAIDGKQMRLAPGANIRDRNNFIIMPAALPPDGALADYATDFNGQVFRVWLLTEEEAARPKKKPAR